MDKQGRLTDIKLKEEFGNCTYPAYIYNKVLAASKSCDLLFCEDKEVMEKIMKEIGIDEKEVVRST